MGAYPCTQMGLGLPKYPWFRRNPLDDLVTRERHPPTPLAHLALG